MSLRKKTASGLFWTFSQQFSVQLINFIVQIVLARLLLPEAFGLIAMLQIFVAIGQSLMDGGMTSSLIRTTDADQSDYSTVFFMNLFSSIFLYIVLYLCAPAIANFYEQPILSPLVRVYTLSFIIRALVGVQTTLLTKEMNFKLQMYMQIPSVIIGGSTGVILAYMGYGVWSLVALNLVQAFIFMIQHWFRTSWRPSLIISKAKLKYHFNFGYKLTASGIIDVAYQNAYTIVIGKFFTPTSVGFYNQSRMLSLFPVRQCSTALDKVSYPMFASIKHDNDKLKIVYKKLFQQIFFWIAPILSFLIVSAEPLFRLILKEKWLPAVPYFQILCLSAMAYPFHKYNLNILNVKGRSDLYFRLELVKKITGLIVMFCAIPLGIIGLIWAQVITSFSSIYINTHYSGRMINYPIKEQILDILPELLICIFATLVSWGCDTLIKNSAYVSDFLRIIVSGFFFFTIYMGTSYLSKIPALLDFKDLIIKYNRIQLLTKR